MAPSRRKKNIRGHVGELGSGSVVAQRAAEKKADEEMMQRQMQETGVEDMLTVIPPMVQLLHEILLIEGANNQLANDLGTELTIWSGRLDECLDNFNFSADHTDMSRQEKQGDLLVELKQAVTVVMDLYENPSNISPEMRQSEARASVVDNQTREEKVKEVETLIRFSSFAQPAAPAYNPASDPFATSDPFNTYTAAPALAVVDPFAHPFAADPFAQTADPFGQSGNPFDTFNAPIAAAAGKGLFHSSFGVANP